MKTSKFFITLLTALFFAVGSMAADKYELTTNITDGDYVLGCLNGTAGKDNKIQAIKAEVTSGWGKYTSVTPSDGVITDPASTIVWTLSKTAANSFTLKNGTKYYNIGTGTGDGSVSMSTTESDIYFAAVGGTTNAFEISGASSFSVGSGNQLACNQSSSYGYRQYSQRTHATTASGIATQVRFFRKLEPHAVTYDATALEAAGGYITLKDADDADVASASKFIKGTKLFLDITPDASHVLDAIKITKTGVTPEEDVTATVYDAAEDSITMPDYPISISATFKQLYSIDAADVIGISFSWEDEDSNVKPGTALAGVLVLATYELAPKYAFDNWNITSGGSTVDNVDGLFTMPAGNVTISAVVHIKSCTQLVMGAVTVNELDYKGAKLSWASVDNAVKYAVRISVEETPGNFVVIEDKSTTDTEYMIQKELDGNTKYYYSVQAIPAVESTEYCESDYKEGDFTTDPDPDAILTYSINGDFKDHTGSYKIRETIMLDASVVGANPCSDKKFIGWSHVEIAETDTKPTADFYEPSGMYKVVATKDTLYAVFAVETLGPKGYMLVNEAPTAGENVILARLNGSTYEAIANVGVGSSKTATKQELTTENDTVKGVAGVLWDVRAATGAVNLHSAANTSTLLHINNSAVTVANGTNNADIVFEANGDGTFKASRGSYYIVAASIGFIESGDVASAVAWYVFKERHTPSTFSAYATSCMKSIATPSFSVSGGTYTVAQTVELSHPDGATIYYTLDGTTPTETSTVYTTPIEITGRGETTIMAFAKNATGESSIVSEVYNLDLPYTPSELATAALSESGTLVTLVLNKTQIAEIAENKKGLFFDIKALNDKNMQIYYVSEEIPSAWEIEGTLTGSIYGKWFHYTSSGADVWELTPTEATWTWISLTYEAPGSATALINTYDDLKALKTIESDQLVIIKNGVRYNVLGTKIR